MYLYKYGRREHLDALINDGTIQIGTLYAYDETTHGPMIGDDQEGRSYQVFTDENTTEMVAAGTPLPSRFGIPFFGSPGSRGNVVQQTNISFNYAIYCSSHILHQRLCKDFSEQYDCAIVILRPFVFFHEVTNAFQASGLVERVEFSNVADVHYRSRNIDPAEEVIEAFVKEPKYALQGEVRALWNIGERPSQPFYRFNAPKASMCCRLIPFDALPSYEPGSPPEIANAAIAEALRRSEGYGR